MSKGVLNPRHFLGRLLISTSASVSLSSVYKMYVNKNLANAYFVMGRRLYMKSGNKNNK